MAKELIQQKTGYASNIFERIPDTNILNLIRDNVTSLDQLQNADSLIIVREAADFGVIDSTKVYYIDGIIDMGTTSIEVPAGGISLHGSTFDVSQLISSEDNYTMFTAPIGGSGNVLAHDMSFTTSGTNSQVFALIDATGFNAIELSAVNFNNCTSLGYLDGYRQGLETGTGRFGGSPELEFRNAMVGGYRVDTSIVRSVTVPTALFKAGSGLAYSGRFIIGINADLPATGALIDFAPSNINNDESLQLRGCRITRNGVINTADTTIHPNIDEDAVQSLWSDNVGVPNTVKYIRSNVTAEVETTISVIDTYYPLAGTFTVQEESHFDMPSNGEFRLLSGNGRYQISGDLIIDGSPNNELDVRVTKSTDDGATWPTQIFHIRRQVNSLVGGRDVAFFPFNFITSLVDNDRIRLEIENKSGTANVTMELDSYIIVAAV
jgi:hypothetical protein